MSAGTVLFVDVQAVGSPGSGFLMEIAWKPLNGEPHCFFIRCGDVSIPAHVRRLTGISPAELSGSGSVSLPEVRELFMAAAGLHCTQTPLKLAAHHAVYEKRWLDHLTGMDLSFICTRQMAKSSMDGLRSGSLRAVAGVTGHVMGEQRRALEHVLATEAIYTALTEGYHSSLVSREARLALPDSPGVYRFLDAGGRCLYAGKAKNLRNRVNSHFTGKADRRHGEMICRVAGIEIEITETAFQAAVLESLQISELSPEYNRAGRILDPGLWYLSADMTGVSRNPGKYGCFGPFTGSGAISDLAGLVADIYNGTNKMPIVDNSMGKLPFGIIESVFPPWREEVLQRGILQYGKELFIQSPSGETDGLECAEPVIDERYARGKLDSIIIAGTLQCRRSAAVRILAGCSVTRVSDPSSGTVHNFVDNSATEPWSQAKVRKLSVVLTELKRIYREGWNPELITRKGIVISGERLGRMLGSL